MLYGAGIHTQSCIDFEHEDDIFNTKTESPWWYVDFDDVLCHKIINVK